MSQNPNYECVGKEEDQLWHVGNQWLFIHETMPKVSLEMLSSAWGRVQAISPEMRDQEAQDRRDLIRKYADEQKNWMRLHPGEWRDSHNKWSLSNIPIAFPNEEEERYVEQIQLLCREVRQSEKDPSLQRFGLGLRKPNEIQKTNSGTQSTNPESNIIGTNLESGVTTPVKSTQHGRTVQASMPLPSPFMSRSSVQTGAEQDQVNIYLNTKDHPTLKVLGKAPVGKKEMETFC